MVSISYQQEAVNGNSGDVYTVVVLEVHRFGTDFVGKYIVPMFRDNISPHPPIIKATNCKWNEFKMHLAGLSSAFIVIYNFKMVGCV
jgi:hypothetical protein